MQQAILLRSQNLNSIDDSTMKGMMVWRSKRSYFHYGVWVWLLICPSLLYAHEVDRNIQKNYEISAGPLGYALSNFAIQASISLSFDPQLTESLQTAGLHGAYSYEQGFSELLKNTQLELVNLNNNTWTIVSRKNIQDNVRDMRNVGKLEVIHIPAQASSATASAGQFIHRSNLDLVRSENDIQPYKILTQAQIKNSGASSLDELLQKTLLSNVATSNFDGSGFMGNTSQLNLRGLGAAETLVLINGRRSAGVGYRGLSDSTDQQNVNNIPLATIERIEILPTTASAIYGSGALGGVINIVLRRDYQGTEVNLRYDNSFVSDTAIKKLTFVTGMLLENSKTQILFTGYQSQANELTAADRDFHQQARSKQISQYPSSIYGMNSARTRTVNPPAGALVNIRTQDGSALLPQYSNASFAYLPKGYAGYAQDGWEPLLPTLGQYDLNLSEGLSNFSNASSLVAESQEQSLGLNIYQPLSKQVEIYLESSYNKSVQKTERGSYDRFDTVILNANAENNPFGKTVLISYPVRWEDTPQRYRYITNKNTQVLLGLSYQPNKDWTIQADYKWSTAFIDLAHPRLFNEEQYIADYISGVLDLLRDTASNSTPILNYWETSRSYTKQTVYDYNLRGTGGISSWYAGNINLVVGGAYQRVYGEGIPEFAQNPERNYLKLSTRSMYSEVKVPFISRDMQLPWVKDLEFQFAVRHDHSDIDTQNTTFSSLSPTVGFRFIPHENLIFRASYGKGTDYQQDIQFSDQQLRGESVMVVDPNTGQTVEVIAKKIGRKQSSEKIKSANIGVVYHPSDIKNFRLSVDYYHIKKKNGLTNISAQDILNHESLFSDRVTRDEQGNLLMVDTTAFKTARLESSGFDVSATLFMDQILHGLNFEASYAYVNNLKKQIVPAQRSMDFANYLNIGPLKNRASLQTTLNLTEQWTLGWDMRFYGKYKLLLSDQIGREQQEVYSLASQTYHDLFFKYKMPTAASRQWGTPELSFGIKNLFANYEIDLSSTSISSFTDPRLRQYFFNLKFNF